MDTESNPDSGRSRRKSPIDHEIQMAANPNYDKESTFDMFNEDDDEIIMFTPK